MAAAARERAHVEAWDGVRGLAILLVLVGHAVPQLWPLSAAGVTVFFALSGFLITRLLLRERDTEGRTDLRQFYVRRVFRLAPMLLIVLAATVVWCLVMDVYRGHLPRDVAMTLLYVSNWGLQQGDFTTPLSQMWSLSVEEQFYLFWPLVVLLLAGLRPRLTLVAGGLGVLSVSYRLAVAGTSIVAVYYSSICVSCALLAGCLVAILEHRVTWRWTGLLAGAPLAVVVACYLSATLWGPWQVGWTGALFLPLVGAVTALGLPLARRMTWLGWLPLVWFGGISYSLYLWQTPVEYAGLGSGPLGASPAWVVLVVAVPLAWATTRWVERPLTRYGRGLSRRIGRRSEVADSPPVPQLRQPSIDPVTNLRSTPESV
jgi:peptidoglycan/LPS O-acetylase OafA/YrhL